MDVYGIGPLKSLTTRNRGLVEVGSVIDDRTITSMRLKVHADGAWSLQLFAEDPHPHPVLILAPFSNVQEMLFDVPSEPLPENLPDAG